MTPVQREKARVSDELRRRANREATAARQQAYRLANPEAVKASQQAWRKAHRVIITASDKARYEAHKDELAAYRHRILYNLTPGEYDAMLAAQGGRCGICRKKPGTRRLAVDHDHATDAIRGLLCRSCNLALSVDRNTVAHLRRAIAYIQHPPAAAALAAFAWVAGTAMDEDVAA
jgi:Recombination endonuclease VII